MSTPLYKILNAETSVHEPGNKPIVKQLIYKKKPFIDIIVSEPENFETELDKTFDLLKLYEAQFKISKAEPENSVQNTAKYAIQSKFDTIKKTLADFQYWLDPKNLSNSDYRMRERNLMKTPLEIDKLTYIMLTAWPENIHIGEEFDTSSYDRLAATFYNHIMLPKQLRISSPITDVRMRKSLFKALDQESKIYFDKERKEENLNNPRTTPHCFVREMTDYLEYWKRN